MVCVCWAVTQNAAHGPGTVWPAEKSPAGKASSSFGHGNVTVGQGIFPFLFSISLLLREKTNYCLRSLPVKILGGFDKGSGDRRGLKTRRMRREVFPAILQEGLIQVTFHWPWRRPAPFLKTTWSSLHFPETPPPAEQVQPRPLPLHLFS